MPKDSLFPDYSGLATAAKVKTLERLSEARIEANPFVHGPGMARLCAAALRAFAAGRFSESWKSDEFLSRSLKEGRQFQLFLACLFDIMCNAEYVHGRLVNSRWIYCDRPDHQKPTAYFSFLKQCPFCCLDKGLEKRLTGAQHKPSSHHIGEITTTAVALLLKLVFQASPRKLSVAVVTKQSHDVDLVAFSDALLLLLEVKASPMASFPIAFDLKEPLFTESPEGRTKYRQHSLVDVTLDHEALFLFVPHRKLRIPIPRGSDAHWPYGALTKAFRQPERLLAFYSGWLELFYAYSVHKPKRNERQEVLAYLVNGWGDEIDSNKTKPGLGRTDDIKKGTYQLLKFGAYYGDDDAKLVVRSALATNLDPLFLKGEYFDKLADIKWGKAGNFKSHGNDEWRIADRYLHHLYNGVLAFNDPIVNDAMLKGVFDLHATEKALLAGLAEKLFREWESIPDSVTGSKPFELGSEDNY